VSYKAIEQDSRREFEEIIFSSPVSGKSVLVIGSPSDHLLAEIFKQSADRVTVIESSPERFAQRHSRVRNNQNSVEYTCADFEEWSASYKSYDLVICQDALHHFYDAVGALRKMMRIARERIVFEVATLGLSRRWHELPLRLMRGTPLLLMDSRAAPIDTAADRTFLFSKPALHKIFNEQTQAFEPLRFEKSSQRGRMIVEARRRKIDHLIVVAGVACVGKTRFMDTLLQSGTSGDRFGIERGELEMINAFRVRSLPDKPFRNLVLHYDILRPHGRKLRRHSRDPVFHLLDCADRITVITLVESRATIIHRSINNNEPSKRRAELAANYDKDDFLRVWYEAWFDAISSRHEPAVTHHIVLAADDYPNVTREDAAAMLR